MLDTRAKAPWHLWAIGIFAVLFNAIGLFDFIMVMARGARYMAEAGMTADQIGIYDAMPVWMRIVWATGVLGAFLASVLLLARRRFAAPAFAISLAAFLVNLLYIYVLRDAGSIMGRQMAVTNVVIAALLLAFGWYARAMTARGVMR